MKKKCAVYREGTMNEWTCQKWFVKFCDGDFLLNDDVMSSRPIEVDGIQIKR